MTPILQIHPYLLYRPVPTPVIPSDRNAIVGDCQSSSSGRVLSRLSVHNRLSFVVSRLSLVCEASNRMEGQKIVLLRILKAFRPPPVPAQLIRRVN